jgi:CHAT domain-containing protein
MNEFYSGIASNDDPVAAMHAAKQALIRTQPGFSKPYYWAGFQVYVRSAAR